LKIKIHSIYQKDPPPSHLASSRPLSLSPSLSLPFEALSF
jgi:hypothetical protein